MYNLSLPVIDREGLDNSILGALGRCNRLAFYNYRLNRASRAVNYPINFGVAYHEYRDVLEKHYMKWCLEDKKELEIVRPTLKEISWAMATKDWKDPPIEHKKGYLDLGRLEKTCDEAFLMWEQEKLQGYYKVLTTETPFDLKLPSGRRFYGRIDQSLLWNNRLWLRDFKTVGRKEDWKEKYNPDHQFTGYVWAAQQLSGRRVEGVIVDIVYNIKTKGPEFHPTLATRTSEDIAHWLEWIEDEYDNWDRACREGTWPMRTTACGDYGGCYFRECCNSGSWASIENWLENKTIYSVWDPMNPDKEEGLPE